jgi:hypothetical protein
MNSCVSSPEIDGGFQHRVVAAFGFRIGDHADTVEHEDHGVRLAQRAAILRERRADVAAGAVAIVGLRFHDQRHPARAIALVTHFLDILRAGAGCLVDGALDVVLGHRKLLGRDDGGAQARIVRRIGHAHLRGDEDFARQLGEQLGAHRIHAPLAVHDVLELTMAGHGCCLSRKRAVR